MLLMLALSTVGAGPPWIDPITAQMRASLGRINKIHVGMSQKVVDDAIEALHRDIARMEPKVFVPLAIGHLMILAPKDTRTRVLLRRAMENRWLEEETARAMLVRAGDMPGPHVKVLLAALDSKDAKSRSRAISALGGCGKAAVPALPRLRDIIEKARADPNDFRRAYTVADEVPEHVRAHWAVGRIEAEVNVAKP